MESIRTIHAYEEVIGKGISFNQIVRQFCHSIAQSILLLEASIGNTANSLLPNIEERIIAFNEIGRRTNLKMNEMINSMINYYKATCALADMEPKAFEAQSEIVAAGETYTAAGKQRRLQVTQATIDALIKVESDISVQVDSLKSEYNEFKRAFDENEDDLQPAQKEALRAIIDSLSGFLSDDGDADRGMQALAQLLTLKRGQIEKLIDRQSTQTLGGGRFR